MAKRDKLTHRQQRQVAKTQKKRRTKESQLQELGDLSAPLEGLIVSRYGEQADVIEFKTATKYRCYLRQNLGSPVPGDKVTFRVDNNNQGVVETLYDRESVLQRPSQHQGLKPVVANIEKIFVVIAPLPDFSAMLLDRYLVAIENAGIPAHIIANKWELEEEVSRQNIEEQLRIYKKLDYPITFLSTKTGLGMDEFIEVANKHTSVLVGQSGVGKSSIINQIFPDQYSRVDVVSENSRLGQHTTTASQLFLFQQENQSPSGFIIDSPGIREFGLWHMDSHTVANGYKEFEPYLGGCKFRDCRHINEPGCAIIEAANSGNIDLSRWQNYCKIVTTGDS